MEKITSKSTKSQILDAYNKAIKKLNEIEASKDDPVSQRESQMKKETFEAADKIVAMGILNPEITGQYKSLELAIEMKKNELKDLYDLEAEANSLTAMINAHKDTQRELEEEAKENKKAIEAGIKALEAELKAKEEEVENEVAEERERVSKIRQREEEEYQYNLKRKRQLEDDEWEDNKKARESVIASKEEDLVNKAKDLSEKETYIADLEDKVASISDQVASAYEEGKKEGKAKADKSNAFEVRSLETKHEYEVQNLQNQIDRLEKDLETEKSKNNDLQNKLDDAYAQMRELATNTVKSVGGVKILSNDAATK